MWKRAHTHTHGKAKFEESALYAKIRKATSKQRGNDMYNPEIVITPDIILIAAGIVLFGLGCMVGSFYSNVSKRISGKDENLETFETK